MGTSCHGSEMTVTQPPVGKVIRMLASHWSIIGRPDIPGCGRRWGVGHTFVFTLSVFQVLCWCRYGQFTKHAALEQYRGRELLLCMCAASSQKDLTIK